MSFRLNRLVAAVPLAAGLAAGATAVTSSTSVEAATGIEICITINGKEHCFELPFAIDWSEVLCPGCPPDFQFRDDWAVNPETLAVELSEGLGDLLVADLYGDRALRAEGIAHVQRAAELAGSRFAGVPSSMGWVTRTQQDVVDAVTLFDRAAATRDPSVAARLQASAIGELDQAVAQIAANVEAG